MEKETFTHLLESRQLYSYQNESLGEKKIFTHLLESRQLYSYQNESLVEKEIFTHLLESRQLYSYQNESLGENYIFIKTHGKPLIDHAPCNTKVYIYRQGIPRDQNNFPNRFKP